MKLRSLIFIEVQAMRFSRRSLVSLLCLFTFAGTFGSSIHAAQVDRPRPVPRLILQLTVDQLRGDMLARYRNQFGTQGFRNLTEQGTVFTNAHYGTANDGAHFPMIEQLLRFNSILLGEIAHLVQQRSGTE